MMDGSAEHHDEYDDPFVAGLEWMWGEGFLSPGGAREVRELLDGLDLSGSRVLDVGCGLGAIDVLLVREHGAGHVTGIDVEGPLIERARHTIAAAGVEDSVELRLVEPGPLPIPDESFDVVFSKDAIIHIPDKSAFYADVRRVLRPGGLFVGSDWLRGGSGPYSEPLQEWLDIVGLTFEMENLESSKRALERAGFVDVQMRDRNDWYRRVVRNEVASVAGENYARLVAEIGAEAASQRRRSSTAKQVVVERGELRPTHFRAYKASV